MLKKKKNEIVERSVLFFLVMWGGTKVDIELTSMAQNGTISTIKWTNALEVFTGRLQKPAEVGIHGLLNVHQMSIV